MRFVVGVFRLIWVGLLVCFVLFAVLVLFRFISSSTKGRMIRRVAAWLPMAFGIRVRVKGRVPDEGSRSTGISSRGKGYLICANHISFADIFVLDSVLPSRFVAKAEREYCFPWYSTVLSSTTVHSTPEFAFPLLK